MENQNLIRIVGCGDIGRRVANLYLDSIKAQDPTNIRLHGIVASAESLQLCKQLGMHTQRLNLDTSYSLEQFHFANSGVFYFAPPPAKGATDSRLNHFLAKLSELKQIPKRIVLISTTGVYGDSKGEWIDENTPVNPQADRAVRRLSAEQILQCWAEDKKCEFQILRVAGIYAQDRLPLTRLEQGLPIVNENEAGFSNRIHADDLAAVCKAAMESETHNQLINVSDGNPSTMTDYFNRVADFAKLPRPPQISLQQAEKVLSEGMVSYLKESRRIRNNKMLDILAIELLYPSLDSSLKIK